MSILVLRFPFSFYKCREVVMYIPAERVYPQGVCVFDLGTTTVLVLD